MRASEDKHEAGIEPAADGQMTSSSGERRMLSRRALPTLLIAGVLSVAGLVTLHNHDPGSLASADTNTNTTASSPAPTTPTVLTALPDTVLSNGTSALRVRLSGPPAANSPSPTLSPSVAGTWSVLGESEYFTPSSTLEPCSTYTMTIWANTTAVGHSRLGKRRTISLKVACPSTRALQQTLARLGYLPYRFHSRYGVHIADGPETRALAAKHAFHPPTGDLVASVTDAPALDYGEIDQTTKGALTVYQADHGIEPTGEPTLQTWKSLLAAETLGHKDPHPYTFVTVSESIPETLEVHRGNHIAISSPANTGVSGAETEQGIFPIYARYESTTMTGTNPDGTKYSDPGVPWVNYFNGGDAVHGFPRASYGSPQSNGCVELPIETAHEVFGMLAIGDIVVIKG